MLMQFAEATGTLPIRDCGPTGCRPTCSDRRVASLVKAVKSAVKRPWGLNKVRYRGLPKNATRAFTALALVNNYMTRGMLLG